jgi:hypothetical protein
MTCLSEYIAVTHNTFLQATPWCTIRPQKEGYVVYNARTDELHLISESGFRVYQQCDGLHTVGEIAREWIRDDGKQVPSADGNLQTFIEQLLARGILEISYDAQS